MPQAPIANALNILIIASAQMSRYMHYGHMAT